MTAATAVEITEARTLATKRAGPRELEVQLIDPGWGSSGYYSADVLEQAAKNRVFKAGTHMYADHPTPTEDAERPQRSIRDLAAILVEDASVGPNGGLVARAKPLNGWGTALAEMKDAIGVSIRAGAYATEGEAEGRRGLIVDELLEAKSVDFVTKAGRGGKILEVLESARPKTVEEARNVGQWIESRLHLALTELGDNMFGDGRLTRAERIALSGAVGDALGAFVARVEADAPELYQRDLWDGPPNPDYAPPPAEVAASEAAPVVLPPGVQASRPVSTTTDPVQVSEAVRTAVTAPPSVTADAPSPVPTPDTTEESMADTQTGTPPVSAAGPAEVTETATRVPVSEAQQLQRLLEESQAQTGKALARAELAEAERDAAIRRATLVEAKWAAETRTKIALATSPLKEASYPSVISDVCNGLSLDEHGKTDDTLIEAAIKAAIDREKTKVAALLEAHGVGVPRGLGGGTGQPSQLSEAAFEEQLTKLLVQSGSDEKSAKLAAEGRG